MNTKKITVNRRFKRSVRALVVTGAVTLVAVTTVTSCSSKSNDASISTEAPLELAASATEAMAVGTEAAAAEGVGGAADFSNDEALLAPNTAAAAASPSDPTGESAELPDLGTSGTYAPIGSAQIKRSEVTLAIPTAQFNASVAQLTSLPGAVGGFITSSNFGGGEEFPDGSRAPRSGVVVMRVPSNEFDGVRKRMPSFGTTISEQISGEEVSAQLVDLNARLTSLRLQEDSYRKLFNAAKQIQDIITVQERITEVRTQIEQIGAKRASLQDQVSMSTITVNVREKMDVTVKVPKVVPVVKKSFGRKTSEAWNDGVGALAALLTGIAVVIAVLAPFAPLLVFAGLLAWLLVRRSRRRNSGATVRTVTVDPSVAPEHVVDAEREDVLV